MTWSLLIGDHRDVLDVVVDHVITDPPYGSRTHEGFNLINDDRKHADGSFPNKIDYTHFSPADVHEFVERWSPRTRGWMVCMTSHDLFPAWELAFERAGRYYFNPLPYIEWSKAPRVLGDGPASWTVYIVVARPRTAEWLDAWRDRRAAAGLSRSLPGAYERQPGDTVWKPGGGAKRIGGKPLGLMRALVSDYTFEGETIADPFAGHGTTLRAADELGRHAIGAERDREAFEAALVRLREPVALDMFGPREVRRPEKAAEQGQLPGF